MAYVLKTISRGSLLSNIFGVLEWDSTTNTYIKEKNNVLSFLWLSQLFISPGLFYINKEVSSDDCSVLWTMPCPAAILALLEWVLSYPKALRSPQWLWYSLVTLHLDSVSDMSFSNDASFGLSASNFIFRFVPSTLSFRSHWMSQPVDRLDSRISEKKYSNWCAQGTQLIIN